ncbi:hypothetical protein [Brasilonema bromeliae]|uniref:hypothetical protein n=1 Tax=Brasilonema bromeliae TaxID=383615 RepID=UPI001B7D06BF|nr:hypothetical protein [Brasilonema bromeliae]
MRFTDVQNVQNFAFSVENFGSRKISQSLVLLRLAISLLEDAFRHTRQISQTQVGAWLLSQFQQ